MLTVERSEYKGHVTYRILSCLGSVPMTKRLTRALLDHRHLIGPRVLYRDEAKHYSTQTLRHQLGAVCRSPHSLRHTFCSHLAMRGAPARSIQELAGHKDLKTTQRYMHLTPAALEGAIQLLERPAPMSSTVDRVVGDTVETAETPSPTKPDTRAI